MSRFVQAPPPPPPPKKKGHANALLTRNYETFRGSTRDLAVPRGRNWQVPVPAGPLPAAPEHHHPGRPGCRTRLPLRDALPGLRPPRPARARAARAPTFSATTATSSGRASAGSAAGTPTCKWRGTVGSPCCRPSRARSTPSTAMGSGRPCCWTRATGWSRRSSPWIIGSSICTSSAS